MTERCAAKQLSSGRFTRGRLKRRCGMLNYLAGRIRRLIGRSETTVIIDGRIDCEGRHNARESFSRDKSIEILIGAEAADEEFNVQRSHLMVNYDLAKLLAGGGPPA
jgi:superfamily II DNA/RNA helicase